MRRNRSIRTRRRIFNEINLTNLIDVTMTTLVCYMIITPFMEQGIDVKLPQTAPHKLEKMDNPVVTITKDNKLYLGNGLVTLPQLIEELKNRLKAKPDAGVIIKADKDVNYGGVINVLDELNTAGIVNVGLATEIKE